MTTRTQRPIEADTNADTAQVELLNDRVPMPERKTPQVTAKLVLTVVGNFADETQLTANLDGSPSVVARAVAWTADAFKAEVEGR